MNNIENSDQSVRLVPIAPGPIDSSRGRGRRQTVVRRTPVKHIMLFPVQINNNMITVDKTVINLLK